MSDKAQHLERLNQSIALSTALRRGLRADSEATERRRALRQWQSQRLQRTHADLLGDKRYAAAARFFVDDLYSANDTGERDAGVARAVPSISKLLPPAGVETAADAIELDALSESLDAAMAEKLGPRVFSLDSTAYAEAYRAVLAKLGCTLISESKSFNKARMLLTYWDWFVLKTGPYAPNA